MEIDSNMDEKRANLEIIAPTINEAIQEGLEKLGLPEDEVDIEILDEGTKGIFGLGSRQTRIRITIKSQNEEKSPLSLDEPGADIYEDDKGSTTDNQDLVVARDTVTSLLKNMNVNANIKAYIGEPDDDRSQVPIHVDIHGDDLSILIGRKAETLNALQFITKLIAGKKLEKSIPINVDVEGYRKRREQQIRKLASRVAEQVGDTGRSQALEPMPAYERRIVHIELRNDPTVFTESTGEGHKRKVVIHPEN